VLRVEFVDGTSMNQCLAMFAQRFACA